MWNGKFKYKLLVCSICKKEFKCPLFQRERKFCSNKCYWKTLKGRKNYWLIGYKWSKERNLKISNKLKGKKFSEEHRRKLSNIAKNRKFSKQTREKLSKALKKRWKNEKEKFIRFGKDNGNWKGGITPKNICARSSKKFIEWRKNIFTRDNFTCQKCGDNKGGNLQAHHIKLFSEAIQERFLTKNGITLCKKCHQKIHKGKRIYENPIGKLYMN